MAALIGKIAASSPAARFKDSRAALGPAAVKSLEEIAPQSIGSKKEGALQGAANKDTVGRR